MKAIMVIIDGMSDGPCPQLYNSRPLEFAGCENLTRLAAGGKQGLIHTCPPGFLPESTICIMSLLGVDPAYYPRGRAGLEALACGLDLDEEDMVLRCNLVAVDQAGNLHSFNGGGLTENLMTESLELVRSSMGQTGTCRPEWRFIPYRDYRSLLVMDKGLNQAQGLITFPPHESTGQPYRNLLPQGSPLAQVLCRFIEWSKEILEPYREKELSYMLWPWGPSSRPVWPSFAQLHGVRAAAVCAIETVRGIAMALGMTAPLVKGGTGDVDTDLSAKLNQALHLHAGHDFLLIHVNGADEAAHRLDARSKAEFLKRVDVELIGPLMRLEAETRIMVCGDHPTLSVTGRHAREPVPFAMGEVGHRRLQPFRQEQDSAEPPEFFSEATAQKGLTLTAAQALDLLLEDIRKQ